MSNPKPTLHPSDFGITNPKFQSLSLQQEQGMNFRFLHAPDMSPESEAKRSVTFMCLPTGSGKTLLNFMIAKSVEMAGGRTLILTHSKALQDQAEEDFAEDGLVIMKGRSNYDCDNGGTCEDGKWNGCSANQDCPYQEAKLRACQSPIVLTNYAFRIATRRIANPNTGEALGNFNCVILDEAHLAPEILSSHLTVELQPLKFKDKYGKHIGGPMLEWWPKLEPSPKPRQKLDLDRLSWNVEALKGWAGQSNSLVSQELKNIAEELKLGKIRKDNVTVDRIKKLTFLQQDLALLLTMDRDNWIVDQPPPEENTFKDGVSASDTVRASPIWVGKYFRYIAHDAREIVMTTATGLPKTAHLLGVSNDQLHYKEWSRIFPFSRNPVIYIPTANMTYQSEGLDETKRRMTAKLREIINVFEGDRGIIHTVSYSRMDKLYEMLSCLPELKHRLMRHERGRYGREKAEPVVDRYLKTKGAVLLSPVLSTGWDFPGDQCRFIVIPKIPFQPTQDLLIKARREQDKSYSDYMASLELQQMPGRGSRYMMDWCYAFILDTAFEWFESAAVKQKLLVKSFIVQKERFDVKIKKEKFVE
jgi:Rad3-related DNA helicase